VSAYIKRVLTFLAVTGIVGLAAGRIYEQQGLRRDKRRLPQLGRSVDIGGRNLNIFCSGMGAPPVIFESAGGPGYFWSDIQPEVAKITTACWYDRAGEGWSDPGPFPRTSAAIVADLHELLHRIDISGPYVLVGWSFGGLNVRVYNGLYPTDVAGMVLVDSAHEEEPRRAPKFFLAPTAPKYLRYPLYLVLRAAAWTGVVRLLQPQPQFLHDPTRKQMIRALRQQPKSVVTDITTGLAVPDSYEQARALARPGDLPLIVLTAGEPQSWSDPEEARQAAVYQQVWIHEIQSQLTRLSTRGRQIVVENSDHGIPEKAPERVTSTIEEVVMTVRAGLMSVQDSLRSNESSVQSPSSH
jgi:pimeloyl-ACP methyl ester carboxylesterase